jgi:hypothetical protein
MAPINKLNTYLRISASHAENVRTIQGIFFGKIRKLETYDLHNYVIKDN